LRASSEARSDGIPSSCGGIGGKASVSCFPFNAHFSHYPAEGPRAGVRYNWMPGFPAPASHGRESASRLAAPDFAFLSARSRGLGNGSATRLFGLAPAWPSRQSSVRRRPPYARCLRMGRSGRSPRADLGPPGDGAAQRLYFRAGRGLDAVPGTPQLPARVFSHARAGCIWRPGFQWRVGWESPSL
jgi:hypothetical protein